MIPMMILIVIMIVILIRIVDIKRTCESCWSHIGDELPDVELNRYS